MVTTDQDRSKHKLPVVIALGLIRGYQLLLSPMLGPRCRFYPSCSCYALEAIEHYGVIRGAAMGLRRLLRCHPGCEGGVDEVPHPDALVRGSR